MNENKAVIHREGSLIQLIFNGRLVASMGWQTGLEFAKAIVAQCKQANAHEKLHAGDVQLITDSAILLRAGAGMALSNHPDVIAEAKKEALHNRNLRRYMPGGVRSQQAVGTPAIIQHEPKPNGRGTP